MWSAAYRLQTLSPATIMIDARHMRNKRKGLICGDKAALDYQTMESRMDGWCCKRQRREEKKE